ncbi:manganese efflux pump MntP family protein [Sporosarcina sp. ACRSL]|uniref:manganese efflux pump MntP n=1 Tax=Sporosarcina sp. ACRSL TaxID=2918215 RepID=UPI001EF656B2|nr:manganese efflux pump [Sporosarcina sp. ACRSL]MCG7343901.1 manganese efflux pump MntP family protein [Sporosarcina sp. ACRSL]
MLEIIAASITTIDIVVVLSLLRLRKNRLPLALWIAFLNMALPFLGFMMGDWSANLFSVWSNLLSGVLLALIGIHMLLQDDDSSALQQQLHPSIIAIAISLDTFSVSVSFGMLHMNKMLFIFASGFLSFVFSCLALYYGRMLNIKNGKLLRWISGLALVALGIMSCF